MLLRRSQLTIRKLSDPIWPVHGAPFSDMVSGPVSPLERNPLSPKGWKNRESDGVGLGVVAALVKSTTNTEKMEKIKHVTVSAPISIACNNHEPGCNWRCRGDRSVAVDVNQLAGDNLQGFQMAEFLNYCYLCRKRLHGKDIYMYRGEKAFCSVECRYQQIVSDEFHEKCGSESEALRPSEASRSSYNDDRRRLFFTGIAAA